MRLLLDTHVFLWLQTRPERLGEWLGPLLDPETERIVSAVVAWEIAIKQQTGALELPAPAPVYVPERMRDIRARSLPIEQGHVLETSSLAPIHRDPFDRLLVAQSRLLGVPILTADPKILAYPAEAFMV